MWTRRAHRGRCEESRSDEAFVRPAIVSAGVHVSAVPTQRHRGGPRIQGGFGKLSRHGPNA